MVLLTLTPVQANLKRTLSAISTLSTGNSLGPEGPCIELGEVRSDEERSDKNVSLLLLLLTLRTF